MQGQVAHQPLDGAVRRQLRRQVPRLLRQRRRALLKRGKLEALGQGVAQGKECAPVVRAPRVEGEAVVAHVGRLGRGEAVAEGLQ